MIRIFSTGTEDNVRQLIHFNRKEISKFMRTPKICRLIFHTGSPMLTFFRFAFSSSCSLPILQNSCLNSEGICSSTPPLRQTVEKQIPFDRKKSAHWPLSFFVLPYITALQNPCIGPNIDCKRMRKNEVSPPLMSSNPRFKMLGNLLIKNTSK